MMKYNFLFISIIFLFVSCGDDEPFVRKTIDYDPSVMPDQISRDVKVMFADSSVTKAILYAGVAKIYNQRKETLLDSGVKVNFYKKNEPVSILTAREALIDDRTKNMIAKKNVVVKSIKDNRKLETEILEWNDKRKKLYSTEYVKITTEKEIIEGYGFESDPNLTDYKLQKVSGIQQLKGNKDE